MSGREKHGEGVVRASYYCNPRWRRGRPAGCKGIGYFIPSMFRIAWRASVAVRPLAMPGMSSG